jgi:GNAT superfamily N-acetyltransferase
MPRIRPALPDDASAIARVHVASWRSTYAGLLPDTFLAALSEERRADYWRGVLEHEGSPDLVLLAEHPDQGVIGFVAAAPDNTTFPGYDVELRAIYLLETWQRGGIGRRMVQAAARELLARGHSALFLWVLAENASRGFYAALGGQELGTKPEQIGGATVTLLAYGWPELGALNSCG